MRAGGNCGGRCISGRTFITIVKLTFLFSRGVLFFPDNAGQNQDCARDSFYCQRFVQEQRAEYRGGDRIQCADDAGPFSRGPALGERLQRESERAADDGEVEHVAPFCAAGRERRIFEDECGDQRQNRHRADLEDPDADRIAFRADPGSQDDRQRVGKSSHHPEEVSDIEFESVRPEVQQEDPETAQQHDLNRMPVRHFPVENRQKKRNQHDGGVFLKRHGYGRCALKPCELKAHDDKERCAERHAEECVFSVCFSKPREADNGEQDEGDRRSDAQKRELPHRLQQ